jgi:hypothetical protein
MNKIKVVFIRKQSDNYFIVCSRYTKNEKVLYNKSTYIILLNNPSYITVEKQHLVVQHIVNVYFVNIDTKEQISLQIVDSKIAHECIDLYLTHQVAIQLAKKMGEQSTKEKILYLIMGAVAGLGIGISIGMNIMMKKLETGVIID